MKQPRFLAGVVDLPYVTTAGCVVTKSGWDAEIQLFLTLPYDWAPDVPDNPTRDQVRAAVVVLAAAWRAYSLADVHGAAGMLSAVFAAVTRFVLEQSPAYAFDAANYGAGKTKAAMALGAVIEGQMPAVTAYAASSNDEETRKRVMSDALGGARFTCLDNVSGYLDNSVLAAALTSGRISDRRMMVMEGCSARVNSLMSFTGANISMSAELQRRTVHIRLDGGDKPTQRVFDFDPVREALAMRREIAVAVCTVLRAYFQAGAPVIVKGDAGGFADWNKLCRQPVLWLIREGLTDGLPWSFTDPGNDKVQADPAASMLADPTAMDPSTAATYALLQALIDVSEGDDFSSADVVKWCDLGVTKPGGTHGKVWEAVRDVSNGRERATAGTVGKVLAYRKERVAGGLKLLVRASTSPIKAWRVVRVG